MIVGGLAAGGVALNQPFGYFLTEAFGGALGGWMGGALPDVIEPANSPNHRQTAHSWAALGLDGGVLNSSGPAN